MYVRVSSAHDTSKLSPPPREVYRRQGMSIPKRCLIYLLIPHVWAAIFFTWLIASTFALSLVGHQHQATVTSRNYIRSRRRGTSLYCRIDYVYDDQRGHHADNDVLGPWAYRKYPPGSPISIRSVRVFGINTSEFASRSHAGSFDVIAAIFVIICDGIVLAIFYFWCLSPLIQWWLVRYGQAVTGQITDKNEIVKRRLHNREYVAYEISYSYPGTDGAVEMHRRSVSRVEYLRADAGQKLQVFYNPRRPRQHLLYQYSDYAPREWQR